MSIETESDLFRTKRLIACSSTSFFATIPESRREIIRTISHEIDAQPNPDEQTILTDLWTYLKKYDLVSSLQSPRYWNKTPWSKDENETINPADFLSLAIAFTDHHKEDFPAVLIPPENKVVSFIEKTLIRSERSDVVMQFETAMQLCNFYPTASALTAMIASRVMSRGQDQRLFPNISTSENDTRRWAEAIKWFPEINPAENFKVPDGTGNNYYFWTNCSAGMLLNSYLYERKDIEIDIYKTLFDHGYELMDLVRGVFVKQPLISNHKLSSKLGFRIGWNLAEKLLSYC